MAPLKRPEFSHDATLCFSFASRPSRFGYTVFNAAFRHLGLNYLYKPVQITTSKQLRDAVAGLRGLKVRGCGVSMPWKREILPLLDRLDESARRAEAANTVVNDDGVLTGFNTDVAGLEVCLRSAGVGRRSHVLVLGAGGVAAAALVALETLRATVTVSARKAERAQRLARRTGARTIAWRSRSSCEADVVLNATSVGMAPDVDASPFEASALRGRELVVELVASPEKTRLLQAARLLKLKTISGSQIGHEQALVQFELYTGRKAPRAVMAAAQAALLRS